jgi:hypothetical protein
MAPGRSGRSGGGGLGGGEPARQTTTGWSAGGSSVCVELGLCGPDGEERSGRRKKEGGVGVLGLGPPYGPGLIWWNCLFMFLKANSSRD